MNEQPRGFSYKTLGASNHCADEREKNDYYATHPQATRCLLDLERFSSYIWEPACGEGHISKVLENAGYNVISTDIIDRGQGKIKDFLKEEHTDIWDGDIVTNPPYKYALEFCQKALEVVKPGHKVAMFLRLQFLEGKRRKLFFQAAPPHTVYVSCSRLHCAKNGEFEKQKGSSAVAYAWFVWQKGYQGITQLKWFN